MEGLNGIWSRYCTERRFEFQLPAHILDERFEEAGFIFDCDLSLKI